MRERFGLIELRANEREDDSAMQDREETAPASDAAEESSELLETFGVNAGIVAEIRQRYDIDPRSVHASWADQFEPDRERDEEPLPEAASGSPQTLASPQVAEKYARVLRMIHAYRARGHRVADTDPLGSRVEYFPELDPAHYGLGKDDDDAAFFAGDLPGGPMQPLAPDPRAPAPDVLPPRRRRVHAHPGPRASSQWLSGAWKRPEIRRSSRRRRSCACSRSSAQPSSSSASSTPSSSGRSASRWKAQRR